MVEDVVHFFVIIEIVTYGTTLLVVMIYLFFASLKNEQQVKKDKPKKNNFERSAQPELEGTFSQNYQPNND